MPNVNINATTGNQASTPSSQIQTTLNEVEVPESNNTIMSNAKRQPFTSDTTHLSTPSHDSITYEEEINEEQARSREPLHTQNDTSIHTPSRSPGLNSLGYFYQSLFSPSNQISVEEVTNHASADE